jgi:ribonuclease BN (tRNA processing enzyme)
VCHANTLLWYYLTVHDPRMSIIARRSRVAEPSRFDVWGCRGSRSLVPRRSRVGNNTSCYSLLYGEDLFVFDAGRGLAALGFAMREEKAFRRVRRVHVLVSHSHMDHWEGLKDADWFWYKGNGLAVRIFGTPQALQALRTGFAHPLYVALDLLAVGTVRSIHYVSLAAGQRRSVGAWTLSTRSLHHYSGQGRSYRVLDTLGFRLQAPDGAVVAYLCDHQPTAHTEAIERSLLRGSALAVYDAHFPDRLHHAHGHGSQEHAASMAHAHPGVIVLAGHYGPALSDEDILAAHGRHGKGTPNFRLAREGDRRRGAFVRSRTVTA